VEEKYKKILKRKEFSCEGINVFSVITVNHPKIVEISVKKPRFFFLLPPIKGG
jgi:hypothetical protein